MATHLAYWSGARSNRTTGCRKACSGLLHRQCSALPPVTGLLTDPPSNSFHSGWVGHGPWQIIWAFWAGSWSAASNLGRYPVHGTGPVLAWVSLTIQIDPPTAARRFCWCPGRVMPGYSHCVAYSSAVFAVKNIHTHYFNLPSSKRVPKTSSAHKKCLLCPK